MTAITKRPASVLNAFLIWFFTNAGGTMFMYTAEGLTQGWGDTGFIIIAGVVGAMITLPVTCLVYVVLCLLPSIGAIAARIMFIILSMVIISVLVLAGIAMIWSMRMDISGLPEGMLVFAPWTISAIIFTIILERRMIFSIHK